MNAIPQLRRAMVSTKGAAEPIPEPIMRSPVTEGGGRVGAVLPNQLFAAFRHYVALHGTTGDQVIREAIERLIDQRK